MRSNRVPSIIVLGICAVMTAVAGCSVVGEKDYPAKRQYVLDANRAGKLRPADGAGVLMVRTFRVSDRFENSQLVYRTGPLSYESDFYNQFLSSPGSLITEEVRQWLGASGVFANVVSAGSRMEARYVLEGNVAALYGDYTSKDAPAAVLEMQFFLIGRAGSGNSIAFHKTYAVTKPLASSGPPALVEGLSACLTEVLKALEADLGEAVPTGAGP
jgi:cholesterol transport system auxiliary component